MHTIKLNQVTYLRNAEIGTHSDFEVLVSNKDYASQIELENIFEYCVLVSDICGTIATNHYRMSAPTTDIFECVKDCLLQGESNSLMECYQEAGLDQSLVQKAVELQFIVMGNCNFYDEDGESMVFESTSNDVQDVVF